VNASISGETTSGGLARLPHALAVQQPRIVLLELGANDGLRGLPLDLTRSNLDQMLTLLQRQHVAVLLLGLRMPPNYGERYTTIFANMYQELATAHKIALLPFLLDRVALNPALMQADGLHPNEQGQPLLLDNVWPKLLPLLRAAGSAGGA
jgi:acyl-CoA thioesterase-1